MPSNIPNQRFPANNSRATFLRYFSKFICFATLFLIFVGGMVTSTDSGLAVPDWPLSYGMIFPPMVGGVFYEHSHRMVAAAVGFLMLCLTVAVQLWEKRKWVRNLTWGALGAVIAQGILGGITVQFFLPTPISVAHGVLSQTFLVLTIIIAYSLSLERENRSGGERTDVPPQFLKSAIFFTVLIYLQLIIGAVMRHTAAGLAIPDFPKMGGEWIPRFDQAMLEDINYWRFMHNLESVTILQVLIHFLHRLWVVFILITLFILNALGRFNREHQTITSNLNLLNFVILLQVALGIVTVLSGKAEVLTSLHVANGAASLGVAILFILRLSPISLSKFKKVIVS